MAYPVLLVQKGRGKEMTDYTKLVKALRCKRDDCEGCVISFFDKDEGWMCQYAAKDDDAAAAIEELQSILTEADKKQAYQHDYICELVAEKEELQAETERLKAQLPKRGKWKVDMSHFSPNIVCSVCGVEIPCVAGWCMDAHMNYCPNCGAKMEVSE